MGCELWVWSESEEKKFNPIPTPDPIPTAHSYIHIFRLFMGIVTCLLLAGCSNIPLKGGELYLNEKTSVGMDDFGVAKVRNQF